jgi:MFS family permease
VTNDQVPLRTVIAGRRGAFLIALLLAEFGAAMQGIAYSTVLPVVAEDLDGFALFGATLAAGSVAAVLMLSFAPPILGRVRPSVVLFLATALYVVGAAMAVFAPSMGWVLAGTIVRGLAAGLLGGFGMGAIGALFDGSERPRVFGLFALVWLLPSLVGPGLNALVTETIGWRWALAWPALLVLVARGLMGAYVAAVPWEPGRPRVRAGAGILVAVCLAVGAWGSTTPGPAGLAVLVLGVIGGAVGIGVFLRRSSPTATLFRVLLAFTALCAGFFGLYELLAAAIVSGLQAPLPVAAAAVMAGLVAWSIAGLRPRPDARPDRVVVGTVLVALAVIASASAIVVTPSAVAIVVLIVSSAVAGLGMGWAYPLLSSEPFESPAPANDVGPLIAFGETAGTAWAVLLGGGALSQLHATGLALRDSAALALALVAAVAVGAVVIAATRGRSVEPAAASGDL